MSIEQQIKDKKQHIKQLQVELAALKVQQALSEKDKAYAPYIFPYNKLSKLAEQYGFQSYLTIKTFYAVKAKFKQEYDEDIVSYSIMDDSDKEGDSEEEKDIELIATPNYGPLEEDEDYDGGFYTEGASVIRQIVVFKQSKLDKIH